MIELEQLSTEPLSVETTDTNYQPLIRAFYESPDVFVFCPRSFVPHIVASLAAFPIVFWLCQHFEADMRETIGFSLLPLFGAGGFVGAELLRRFTGLRARFDRSRQLATISGEPIAFSQIQAVQIWEQVREIDEDERIVRQVNLVHITGGATTRLNLLQGTQPELIDMARKLAGFLDVPTVEHLIGKAEFTAMSRRERIGLALCLVAGLLLLLAVVYVARMAQQNNNQIICGGLLGIGITTLAVLALRRIQREIRTRPPEDSQAHDECTGRISGPQTNRP